MTPAPAFDRWLESLERRHLSDLTFPEVRRALQAVSTSYVERRDRLSRHSIFDGAGKRAAFAMFYGPLHYLVVRHVVDALDLDSPTPKQIVDLGCGTGVASAAWAASCSRPPALTGVDKNGWVVDEARRTWSDLGLRGKATRGDAVRTALPGRGAGIVAGWFINELPDASRGTLLDGLRAAADGGARLLVIEPIAKRVSPWWGSWATAFEALGGRADNWRFPVELPPLLGRLDRAAGLRHHELKARTLSV